MGDPQPIVTALDSAGYRLTGPRRALADLIVARRAEPRSPLRTSSRTCERGAWASDGLPCSAPSTCSRPSAQSSGSTSRAVSTHTSRAFPHTTTTSSARAARNTTEIGDIGLGAVAREVARRTGYRVDEHRLELFGLCPACQRAATQA